MNRRSLIALGLATALGRFFPLPSPSPRPPDFGPWVYLSGAGNPDLDGPYLVVSTEMEMSPKSGVSFRVHAVREDPLEDGTRREVRFNCTAAWMEESGLLRAYMPRTIGAEYDDAIYGDA